MRVSRVKKGLFGGGRSKQVAYLSAPATPSTARSVSPPALQEGRAFQADRVVLRRPDDLPDTPAEHCGRRGWHQHLRGWRRRYYARWLDVGTGCHGEDRHE